MDTDKQTQYWRTVRLAGTIACLLGLLTLVAWYIPEHSLQNCRQSQMFDCSIHEDTTINHAWGLIGFISLLGAISGVGVVAANALFAWRKPKSFDKVSALFAVISLATILLCVFLFWWVPKAFPGNTINWRHDQAMSAIWWDVFTVSAILFIMSLTAALSSVYWANPAKRPLLKTLAGLICAVVILWLLSLTFNL